MKIELLDSYDDVHPSEVGRMSQSDPTVATVVPIGEYTLHHCLKKLPNPVQKGEIFQGVAFKTSDSFFGVSPAKFRGFGYLEKKLSKIIGKTPDTGDLTKFLASSPKVRVLGTVQIEVDLYGTKTTPTEKVKANYPVWELITEEEEK